MDEMQLNWHADTPIQINDLLELPQFELIDHHTRRCKQSYITGEFKRQCQEAFKVPDNLSHFSRHDLAYFVGIVPFCMVFRQHYIFITEIMFR